MPNDISFPPDASVITLPALQHVLSLYDTTLDAFYETKVKDGKKRAAATANDKWRYEDLPARLNHWHADSPDDKGLTLTELEKLVEWKITHGKFRPFLLPQIRKNAPDQVIEGTGKCWSLLLDSRVNKQSNETPSDTVLKKALDAACVLNGVGPATGTLLLSIFSPGGIPFFQDELFTWLRADINGAKDSSKLKYNAKEYFELINGVRQLRSSLGGDQKLQAWEIEKAGFVIGHWHLIGPEQRQEVWNLMGNTEKSKKNLSEIGGSLGRKRRTDELLDGNPVQRKKKKESTAMKEAPGTTGDATEKQPPTLLDHENSLQPAAKRQSRRINAPKT